MSDQNTNKKNITSKSDKKKTTMPYIPNNNKVNRPISGKNEAKDLTNDLIDSETPLKNDDITYNNQNKIYTEDFTPISVSETEDEHNYCEIDLDTPYNEINKNKNNVDMYKNQYKIMTDQFKNQQIDAYKSEFYKMKSEINDFKYHNKKLLDEINEIKKHNYENSRVLNKPNEYYVIKSQQDTIYELIRSSNMSCSEGTYLEYKRIPEDGLSLIQMLKMKSFENESAQKNEISKLRKESDNQKSNLMLTSDQFEKTSRELEHIKKQYSNIKYDFERKSELYDERELELTQELQEKTSIIKKSKEQNRNQSNLEKRNNELEIDLERIRIQYSANDKSLETLNKDKISMNDEFYKLKTENELLKNDKDHLRRELESSHNSNKILNETVDKYERKLENSRKAKEDLSKQMSEYESGRRWQDVQKHFTVELERLKEHSQKELENSKKQIENIHEKEIRTQRDTLEKTHTQYDKLESRLKEKESSQDAVNYEYRTMRSKLEADNAELRGTLKLKTFELEKQLIQYEASYQSEKELRAEVELQRDKFELVKSEFAKSENNFKCETADLRAELAIKREQLQTYTSMERDLDHLVETNMFSDTNIFDRDEGQTLIEGMPTKTVKRAQQSMKLANRLSIKNREYEDAKRERDHFKKQNEILDSQLRVARITLEKTAQPYGNLIKDLETKEYEMIDFRRTIGNLTDSLAISNEENRTLLKRHNEMEKDLLELTSKRKVVDALHVKLEAMLKVQGKSLDNNKKDIKTKQTKEVIYDTRKKKPLVEHNKVITKSALKTKNIAYITDDTSHEKLNFKPQNIILYN